MKAETKLRVAACAAGFALPRYNDLLDVQIATERNHRDHVIVLQMINQTVQFVNGYFRSFCGVELTPSMVSHYVKKGVVDHPIRKKYTRDQIASLMYIAVSKTVLSIENIDTLFKMQREHCSAGTAYDIFCEELETSLSVVFGGKAAQPETTLNDERLLLRSTIFAAVNKIYLDCCFDALRQEQALWSDILPDLA
jgi:DNA-binding transcriptional MerR regulator